MPPLDVYLHFQKILLTIEEREHPKVNNVVKVPAKVLLVMEVEELPPPTAMPDLAPSQSSVKDMLGYLQDYVGVFVGWVLDT